MEGQFRSFAWVSKGAVTRVRLLASPVKPTLSQVGGTAPIPLFTAVLTVIVVPALKVASDPPPSPTTLNSEIFQPLVRSGKPVSPDAVRPTPPTVKVTASSGFPFTPATRPPPPFQPTAPPVCPRPVA